MATVPGAPRSDKPFFFFGLSLYLAGKYCEKFQVPWAQLEVNPAKAITWFVGVTIYCTFFNNNSPLPRQFLCNKILFKKISYSKRNAYWTNFWIERASGPPGHIRVCIPITGCFNDKTIISEENIPLECYLLLQCSRRRCTLLPLTWAKPLRKINPKLQHFKRVLDLHCKQQKDWTT